MADAVIRERRHLDIKAARHHLKSMHLHDINTLLAGCLTFMAAGLSGGADEGWARTEEGFRIPRPHHQLAFPEAHGSHPEFAIEWWYVTGHLFDAADKRFGFQATFFRRAAPRRGSGGDLPDTFGDSQVFLAHMALLDVSSGRFYHAERINRDGWNAYSKTGGMDMANGNWSLRMEDTDTETMRLRGSIRGYVAFDLKLRPRKPMVRFGEDNGLSRKGADPDAVSYYLTFTRLEAEGSLEVGGDRRAVRGEAWLDHEIASSQLSPGLEGWDWAAIQLFDGREVKVYILRQTDGKPDPLSAMIWIDANGATTYRYADAFNWRALRHWQSPISGARYPIEVAIGGVDPETGETVRLHLQPLLDAQEIAAEYGPVYWEGACRVLDEEGREIGRAYLELAGYDASLEDRL